MHSEEVGKSKKRTFLQAEAHGFRVSKQTIEAHGLCAECQKTEDSTLKEQVHEC